MASAMGHGMTSPVQNAKATSDYIYLSESFDFFPDLPQEERSILLPIVLGLSLGLVALGVISFLVYWCCLRAKPRDTKFAPKDASHPVTIIFTDIQSSTSLWAEIPDAMGPALNSHHRLIRGLIQKHIGYEVKTIGDAFMVAFQSAYNAVTFAHELQFCFYDYTWESGNIIDETYHQLELARIADIQEEMFPTAPLAMLPNGGASNPVLIGSETVMPTLMLGNAETASSSDIVVSNNASQNSHTAQMNETKDASILRDPRTRYFTCNLSLEQYVAAWNGLRVRIGINTGFADIKYDVVTKGYDYYGSITNIASRTEACAWGGQIVITEMTRDALIKDVREKEIDLSYKMASFGLQNLRGVPEPLELWQVYNVPGRYFGPLRLDSVYAKAGDDDDNDDNDASTNDTISQEGLANHRDEDLLSGITFTILSTLFSTTAKKKRTTDLEALCRSWRLRPSPKGALKMLRKNKFFQWKTLMKRGYNFASIDPALMALATRAERNFSGQCRRSPSDRGMDYGFACEQLCRPLHLFNDSGTNPNTPNAGNISNGDTPTNALVLDEEEMPTAQSSVSVALTRQQAVAVKRASKVMIFHAEDIESTEAELIFLSDKISSVALKRLPRHVKEAIQLSRYALINAERKDRRQSRIEQMTSAQHSINEY